MSQGPFRIRCATVLPQKPTMPTELRYGDSAYYSFEKKGVEVQSSCASPESILLRQQ